MLLEVQNLNIEFSTDTGPLRAVDDISFSIPEGKTLGIVGESGCGKSATALSLMKLLPTPPAKVFGKKIAWLGRDILTLPDSELRKIRGKEIAMIFQEPMTSLNPVFTIGYQILEAIQIHEPQISQKEAKDRAIGLLKKVGIPEPERRYESYPHELSGGMRQRVMIAMALSCSPKLLIADEPTTALDVTIQAQILTLLKQLQKDLGMAILLITHDLGVIAEVADDCQVMYAGKIVERGKASEVFSMPTHPYTEGLLNSLPQPSMGNRSRLKGIPGMVPNLRALPPGCRFQDRCPKVKPHCKVSEPLLEMKKTGHEAACFEV